MIFCISVVSVIIPSLSFLIYLGSLFLLLFFIRPYGILVPKSGIGPLPPSLGAQSLNHWTTCEVLGPLFNLSYCILYFSAVWLFFFFFTYFFLFAEVLMSVYSPDMGEHPCNHYFEHFFPR